MGAFSIWHWLLVLLVVILVFGTKKLGNIGKDLGSAVRGFKEGVNGDDKDKASQDQAATPPANNKTTAGSDRR